MSVNAHIHQLQQRHQSLEAELAVLSTSPSTSSVELMEVKRKKLRLKDQINQLQATH